MRMKIYYLLTVSILIFVNILCTNAEESVKASSSNDLSAAFNNEVKNNHLRAGFEVFYKLTNLFIDELIEPSFPEGAYSIQFTIDMFTIFSNLTFFLSRNLFNEKQIN